MDSSQIAEAEALLVEAVDLIEASDFPAALTVIDRAEAIFETSGMPLRVLAARQRRLMVFALTGRLGEAIEGNRSLIGVYEDHGEEISAAKVRTNLGYNLSVVGDVRGASEQYRRAARVFRRHPGRRYELATCYMNLGGILRPTRRRAARAYVLAAHDLFAAADFPVKAGDCLLLEARHRESDGDGEAADALRRDVQDTYEAAGEVARAAHVRYLRGTALGRREDFGGALVLLREALATFLTERAPALNTIADCARLVATAYAETGRPAAGWPFARLAVLMHNNTRSDLHRAPLRKAWLERRGSAYRIALDLALRLGDTAACVELIEATRAQQAPTGREVPEPDLTGEGTLGTAMAATGLITPAPLANFRVRGRSVLDPEDVLAETARSLGLNSSLTGHPVLVREAPDQVDLDRIRVRLTGADGIWWSFVVVKDRLYWACLTSDGATAGEVPFAAQDVARRAVQAITELLPEDLAPDPGRLPEQAAAWQPGGVADSRLSEVAQELLPDEVRRAVLRADRDHPVRIAVAPTAAMGRLPLSLLPVERGSAPTRVLHGAAVIHCPSASLVATHRTTPEAGADTSDRDWPLLAAVVDPTGDLPSTRRLARVAQRRLGTVPARGNPLRRAPAATSANLSAALTSARRASGKQEGRGVVLFAGHSTSGVQDGPATAALLLKDAPLSARELLTARSRADYPLPRRVMFASCASAGLAFSDWFGLTAAAGWLGAETSVCSLWPLVTGRRARELDRQMLEVMTSSQDPALGLREVQLAHLLRWTRLGVGAGDRRGGRKDGRERRSRARHQDGPLLWASYIVVAS
jgi:hypothetical protein